jgi:hypothetical protein
MALPCTTFWLPSIWIAQPRAADHVALLRRRAADQVVRGRHRQADGRVGAGRRAAGVESQPQALHGVAAAALQPDRHGCAEAVDHEAAQHHRAALQVERPEAVAVDLQRRAVGEAGLRLRVDCHRPGHRGAAPKPA